MSELLSKITSAILFYISAFKNALRISVIIAEMCEPVSINQNVKKISVNIWLSVHPI